MAESFWRDRSVVVTGSTGMLGAWLVRRLLANESSVVSLVRDWVPEWELVRTGLIEKTTVVRGEVEDRDLLDRTPGEYEVQTVFHLAAQTIVTIANRNPISTFETNIRGTPNVFDSCSVEDGVAAYMLLAEHLTNNPKLRGQAFNFSNESQISVLDLVNMILRKMGSDLAPEIQNQVTNEIRQQYLSAARARSELKCAPQFTLDQGLESTMAWYREALK